MRTRQRKATMLRVPCSIVIEGRKNWAATMARTLERLLQPDVFVRHRRRQGKLVRHQCGPQRKAIEG